MQICFEGGDGALHPEYFKNDKGVEIDKITISSTAFSGSSVLARFNLWTSDKKLVYAVGRYKKSNTEGYLLYSTDPSDIQFNNINDYSLAQIQELADSNDKYIIAHVTSTNCYGDLYPIVNISNYSSTDRYWLFSANRSKVIINIEYSKKISFDQLRFSPNAGWGSSVIGTWREGYMKSGTVDFFNDDNRVLNYEFNNLNRFSRVMINSKELTVDTYDETIIKSSQDAYNVDIIY